MNEGERDSLLKRLDSQAESGSEFGSAKENRRKHKRWGYRHSEIAVTVEHPAGGISRLLVCARNLSTSGLGFIHAGYLHKGSRCKLLLRGGDNAAQPVSGEIMSCRHIDGMLHEIGVRFDQVIDVMKFVRGKGAAGESGTAATPSVKLSAMTGKILYVDDSIDDRELMKFIFQACGAEICAVASGAEAIGMAAADGFAAVMTELRLPDSSGGEVAKAFRDKGFAGPIIGVTADENPEVAAAAKEAGCSAVLTKPLNMEQATAALGSMANDPTVEPLFSSLWPQVEMRTLITEFVKRFANHVQQLRQSLDQSDVQAAEKLCLMLKGSAGGYGFAQVSRAAGEIMKMMAEEESGTQSAVAEMAAQVEELNAMCIAAQLAIKLDPQRQGEAVSPAQGA